MHVNFHIRDLAGALQMQKGDNPRLLQTGAAVGLPPAQATFMKVGPWQWLSWELFSTLGAAQ